LAADLVLRKVDVIVVQSTLAAEAAKRATSSIPIVMASVAEHLISAQLRDHVKRGDAVRAVA
jgi:ABC-type uncharacterized transport system substrate-binding protein